MQAKELCLYEVKVWDMSHRGELREQSVVTDEHGKDSVVENMYYCGVGGHMLIVIENYTSGT